jgi:hypothetical protein
VTHAYYQLLNRNPKHRLGAQRDAAELKEHPFFYCVDWTALSLKQVTPPFKPVVESDESTSNFDPEFTTADIHDVAEMDFLDDEDPSESWVSQSIGGSGFSHTPNGPLGSDKDKERGPTSPTSPITPTNGRTSPNPLIGTQSQGIQINGKKKRKDPADSPLTSSIQENFRGFTYSGGESLVTPIRLAARRNEKKDAVDDEAETSVTTEDEFEDFGSSAGRYSKRHGQQIADGDI